jgi:thiosulfate reductase cytochrome b subunit
MWVMSMTTRKPGGVRRVRTAQRWTHLASAVLLVAFVYLTPDTDSILMDLIRWIGVPLLAASGIAMWQWPRVRQLRRRWVHA